MGTRAGAAGADWTGWWAETEETEETEAVVENTNGLWRGRWRPAVALRAMAWQADRALDVAGRGATAP